MADPRNSHRLAERIVSWVQESMSELAVSHAPGLQLPRVFAGHRVDDGTRADLIYTLGLMSEGGIEEVAGTPCASRARDLILQLDPAEIEGFAAYRVSETALRLRESGRCSWSDAELDGVIAAGRSDGVVESAIRGELPTNWLVVAARCLAAVERLGQPDERSSSLLSRLRQVFETTGEGCAPGWLDDSANMGGRFAAYDIYTPDMYLFARPLASDIGDPWQKGLRAVLADLDDIAQPGGAVVWGRSVGALALAITVELAGVAVHDSLSARPDRWLARAEASFVDLSEWFRNGIVAAHQNRQPMFYRGTSRRLQMTLDLYGKLLLAALELRSAPAVDYRAEVDTWGSGERLVVFDPQRNAALWTRRSRELSFALPLLANWSTDYLPSPRSPGLFEVPTSGHPCFLPTLTSGDRQLVPAGLPTALEASPGRLVVEHQGWAAVAGAVADGEGVEGSRRAVYTVSGRRLEVEETLHFDEAVDGLPLSLTIPALADRPLTVAVEGTAARPQQIDTSGIAEWRSFWSELPVLHQIEIPTARSVEFAWSVTPQLRVASTIFGHQYDRSLYDPLQGRLVLVPAPPIDENLSHALRGVDILHMAWPEWWSGVDEERTEQVLEEVRASGVKVVWTQHNLEPHLFKTPEASSCYQLWAEAASAVIHHSEWGRSVALGTYDYGPDTTHAVIPHGHWGNEYPDPAGADRAALEEELGWGPAKIRLAVIGTPRVEKNLQLVLDAFAALDRPDMALVIRVDGTEDVPDDPRITLERGAVPSHLYHRRMHAVDALILPFAPSGMLTTGTAFDAIGSGTAAITSDWAFFDEVFDGADIRYGSTAEDLTRCLDGLTSEQIRESASRMADLRERFAWEPIAQSTLDLFESLFEG